MVLKKMYTQHLSKFNKTLPCTGSLFQGVWALPGVVLLGVRRAEEEFFIIISWCLIKISIVVAIGCQI